MNKKITLRICLIGLFWTSIFNLAGQNIKNPILPGVADAGVLKYNGKYYLGGVFTNGDFYKSTDLINWEGPVHVFSMNNDWTKGTGAGDDQIHANDMIYLNGVFNLYWSVNYWGKDKHVVHIGRAVSDCVIGPYHEPVKETWIENRIDPKIFRDDDGTLYMYMVKFTEGNTIWVRQMKDDGSTFEGQPIYQFASLPDTWETMDNRVVEGPWVIKYRNRYYMMYNANHTGTDWGNYQLGVAEADSPILFNNGNKYPHPLLQSNQTAIEEEYVDILSFYDEKYNPAFSYMTDFPPADWKKKSYVNTWEKGKTGFASRKIERSTVRKYGTEWSTENLYLQKVFKTKESLGNLALRILHDGDTRIYINNELVYDKQGADYRIINLENAKMKLNESDNILAVETKKGQRGNYIDLSLFDLREQKADDILFSPGQPNILRGPNGFEWWLIYMANKNNEPRGQYINRIYFFDKMMYSDGVTSCNTNGHFPVPTKPTCSDIQYPEKEKTFTLIEKQYSGTSYLFETGINTTGEAGVIAWWKDANNWIKVGLDNESRQWYIESCFQHLKKRESYPLLYNFKFGVYHTIRIERNLNTFQIRIDDLPASGKSWFIFPEVEGESVPGLFAENGVSSFDGAIFTLGWDEFDEYITPWKGYQTSVKGVSPQGENTEAFKGDFMQKYEYSLQISNQQQNGVSGVYPVYCNKNNYLKAGFNSETRQLEVRGVMDGKEVYSKNVSLAGLKTKYSDVKYTDFIEKRYSFKTPVWLDEVWLERIPFHNNLLFVDNMFDHLTVEYFLDGQWIPLKGLETIASNPMYNKLSFEPIRAEALRFINKNATDENRYIYKIRINELFNDSYNFRCIKQKDQVILIVDGQIACTIPLAYPKAQIGIYSEGCKPVYNGIVRYHIP